MRIRALRSAAGLALVFSLSLYPAVGQSSQPPEMNAEAKMMMEKWMAFAAPSDAHRRLAAKAGSWTTNVKMWQAPDAPPQESTGTSKLEMIMEGRYLQDVTEGTAMGQPFHGRGLTAYDNLKKKYVGTWIDNLGTGVMVSEGTYDPKTKTFTYKSEMPDVVAGKYAPIRFVEKIVSADKWVMEMYAKGPDGKEFKNMQIDYTRKK